MARYIDADLLKQNCKITSKFDDNFICVSLQTLGEVIDAQPTADAAPIVHGEWIDFDIDYGGIPAVAYQCSECGKSNGFITDFCPNCGAKMDGKENKDEV